MRAHIAAILVALAVPATAAGIAYPVNDDQGSYGLSCHCNPYAYIDCHAGQCWWVGQFQWFDPSGHPTGIPCA